MGDDLVALGSHCHHVAAHGRQGANGSVGRPHQSGIDARSAGRSSKNEGSPYGIGEKGSMWR